MMHIKYKIFQNLLLLVAMIVSMNHNLVAQEKKTFTIQIENHKFKPEILEVPADIAFTLTIENLDKTVEEFESDDLRQEKIIGGGKKINLEIKPLKVGEYKFFGEFHSKTAQGKIIVK
jgi:hypothetical protein